MTHAISPWVVADDFIGIYDEQGRCLADMDSEGAPYVDYDESLANAYLMAAAPDLLAALEWAVDVANADQYESCWYATARMAIAKAKNARRSSRNKGCDHDFEPVDGTSSDDATAFICRKCAVEGAKS